MAPNVGTANRPEFHTATRGIFFIPPFDFNTPGRRLLLLGASGGPRRLLWLARLTLGAIKGPSDSQFSPMPGVTQARGAAPVY